MKISELALGLEIKSQPGGGNPPFQWWSQTFYIISVVDFFLIGKLLPGRFEMELGSSMGGSEAKKFLRNFFFFLHLVMNG